ncbi:M48 family metallopeptidase [Desulfobotulus sp.]|uniref:M48 family metallopeptidase n=1 Tax=Desulfobotulus sp. TaxID=1940337 RepID=UPI002A371FAB|nr:M48 family metalloprotease [Desulfobotulus sp.]MDY0161750.1 M48 family metalloprotease [Desulfobotulus sp.]
MFHHLFSTIAALVLVTTHSPVANPGAVGLRWLCILFGITLFFMFIDRWNRRAMALPLGAFHAGFAEACHRRLQVQTVLLLILFALFIHILHLPLLLCPDVVAWVFPFLRDFSSMAFYFLLQSGLWFLASKSAGAYTGTDAKAFIREQMGLSLPALLPWFLLSGIHDLLLLLPFSAFQEVFKSTPGQTIYFLCLFLAIFLFAPIGIQKFWNCTPLPQGPLRHRIEKVLRLTGTGCRDILIWPLFGGRMLTAGIMGPWSRFRYILVTPALLRHLYPEALEAVIAHEAGHAKRYHLPLYVLILAGFLLVSWALLDFFYQGLLLGASFFFLPHLPFLPPAGVATGLAIALTLFFFFFYFRFVFGFFMRNFERQADVFALSVQGRADHLIHTFEMLGQLTGQDPDKPNWHHFSLSERMDFLKACERNPRKILQHDAKVRRSLALYLCGLFLLGLGGGYLHFTGAATELRLRLLTRSLEVEAERSPETPGVLRYLGDLYQEQKAWEKARSAYHRALILTPEDPELLNNLAWLYITAEDRKVADPDLGSYYAEKAVEKSRGQEPHILDTLAEGYHRTGRATEALGFAERALWLQRERGQDTTYYEEQLRRFRVPENPDSP